MTLALVITPFPDADDATEPAWTDAALELIRLSPARLVTLTALCRSLATIFWSSSHADIVERQRPLLQTYFDDADPEVSSWAYQLDAQLEQVVQEYRLHERQRDASFE